MRAVVPFLIAAAFLVAPAYAQRSSFRNHAAEPKQLWNARPAEILRRFPRGEGQGDEQPQSNLNQDALAEVRRRAW